MCCTGRRHGQLQWAGRFKAPVGRVPNVRSLPKLTCMESKQHTCRSIGESGVEFNKFSSSDQLIHPDTPSDRRVRCKVARARGGPRPRSGFTVKRAPRDGAAGGEARGDVHPGPRGGPVKRDLGYCTKVVSGGTRTHSIRQLFSRGLAFRLRLAHGVVAAAHAGGAARRAVHLVVAPRIYSVHACALAVDTSRWFYPITSPGA